MKTSKPSLFLIVAILLSPVEISYAQILDKMNPISFEMSSLNDKVFIATGLYKGELQIYKDFIEVNINKGIVHIQELPNHKGIPFIRKIRFGLETSLESGKWNIYSNSLSFVIEKQMNINEKYQLPTLKFLIPRNPNIRLEKSWLVAIIEISDEGNTETIGYCYTHSKIDIFQTNLIKWNQ